MVNRVTAGALIRVRHDVDEVRFIVGELQHPVVASNGKPGLVLCVVPDIGQTFPARLISHQQASLDHKLVGQIQLAAIYKLGLPVYTRDNQLTVLANTAGLVVKSLADNRANWKFKLPINAVIG